MSRAKRDFKIQQNATRATNDEAIKCKLAFYSPGAGGGKVQSGAGEGAVEEEK